MKTETKIVAEYKTPKCKVVGLHIERPILDGSDTLLYNHDGGSASLYDDNENDLGTL